MSTLVPSKEICGAMLDLAVRGEAAIVCVRPLCRSTIDTCHTKVPAEGAGVDVDQPGASEGPAVGPRKPVST
jgi:hypothetical protein